ncbi:hypothetical protein [Agrobacterium tumefaciens]|uniref:hypothetical protein n=1 Tax=Agrobacterium tumefaciens TaxID=358 RepID=UPI001574B497|nr:hypothetical protein [Agrobacterium tumefaciens]WCJ62925.1 hypothetical protein G6M15_01605 [Agrobacterium tumefaciens]
MIKNIAIAAFAVIAAASAASANGFLSEAASPVAKITENHGKPGDSAVSISNPEVTYRVLKNGMVERKNSRFDTTTYIDPTAPLRDRNRR